MGGLSGEVLLRIAFDGDRAHEAQRFDMDARIREVEQGPDGAIWVLEDGKRGRLLRLSPRDSAALSGDQAQSSALARPREPTGLP